MIHKTVLEFIEPKAKSIFSSITFRKKGWSKKESFTADSYEILADKKSAVGKVTIDCLHGIETFKASFAVALILNAVLPITLLATSKQFGFSFLS